MSEGRPIRCYEYVNQPYEVVRDAVRRDPEGLFRRATKTAAARAETIAAGLRVNIAGLEVSTNIDLVVERIDEVDGLHPCTTLAVRWRASHRPGLFPTMTAELKLYPLSPHETQVDLEGTYQPPLGVLGGAIDAALGHRVAEASVHRFVDDIATRLRQDLES